MLCIKVEYPEALDLKEIPRLSFEHHYQLHTPRESWNHRNMAGHRIFRCQILTLSQIWGQRAKAPWNSTHACIFSFFLASIFEIGKWILRLPVQHVSGGHIPSCGICVFEVILVRIIAHTRPLWSLLDQWSDFALFSGAAHARATPNLHMLQLKCDPKQAKSKNPLYDFKCWC